MKGTPVSTKNMDDVWLLFTITTGRIYLSWFLCCFPLAACSTHGCVYCLLMTVQFQWLYSCVYREKLRSKYGLPDEPCCDCCVHFCCEPCALCQEHAELESRGYDPSRGKEISVPTQLCSHNCYRIILEYLSWFDKQWLLLLILPCLFYQVGKAGLLFLL